MFKNLKIGMKLRVGFAVVLVIMTFMSVLSLWAMSVMDDEVDIITTDLYPKTVWANNVIDSINQIARSMRNTLLLKD